MGNARNFDKNGIWKKIHKDFFEATKIKVTQKALTKKWSVKLGKLKKWKKTIRFETREKTGNIIYIIFNVATLHHCRIRDKSSMFSSSIF